MVWRDVISFYECDPILFLFFATGYWRDPHYPLDNMFYQGYSKTRYKCGLTWQSYWDSRGNTGGDTRRGSSTSRRPARRNPPAPHLSWPQTSCWDRSQCCLGSWTWISSSRRPESRRCEYNERPDQDQISECCWPCKDWTLCVPSVSCSGSSWLAVRSAEGAPAWCLLGLSRLCRW